MRANETNALLIGAAIGTVRSRTSTILTRRLREQAGEDREPGVRLGEARAQRRQADPDALGLAVVGEHAALPQRSHEVAERGVADGHVAAAAERVARRHDPRAERAEQRVDDLERVRRHRQRLRPDRADPGLLDEVEARRQREHPEHGRRAADDARQARGGLVARAHRERVAPPEPAPDRLLQDVLVLGADVAEGGRAGTAVEVLVGAARGEIGAPGVERDLDRPGGVADVPEHERARLVGDVRDVRRRRRRGRCGRRRG